MSTHHQPASMSVLGQFVSTMVAQHRVESDGRPKHRSGRPVNPSSRRQRILAWLDDNGHCATARDIAAGVGVECNQSLYSALLELEVEGKIERGEKVLVGKLLRNAWRTA